MARKRSSKRKPKLTQQLPQRGARGRTAPSPSRGHEVAGIVSLGFSIFWLAGLASLQLGSGRLMGPLGRSVAVAGYALVGSCAYGLAIAIALGSLRLLTDRRPVVRGREIMALLLGMASLATLLHLTFSGYRLAEYSAGGLVGEHLAEVLRAVVSTAGTALLGVVGLAVAVVCATPLRLGRAIDHAIAALAAAGCWSAAAGRRGLAGAVGCGRAAAAGLRSAAREVVRFVGEVIAAILPERDGDDYLDGEGDGAAEADVFELEPGSDPAFVDPPVVSKRRDKASRSAPAGEIATDKTERMDQAQIEANLAQLDGSAAAPPATGPAEKTRPPADDKRKPTTLPGIAGAKLPAAATGATGAAAADDLAPVSSTAPVSRQPEIVESRFRKEDAEHMREREKALDAERKGFIKIGEGAFKLPPISLLDYDDSTAEATDRTLMLEQSARLLQVLSEFNVKGEVTAIRPGPVVTMYEFAPAPGTRLTKITNLQHEVAMALGAVSVRIVAPIPGKSVVGFEIPNKVCETVYLKEIIAADSFRKAKSNLALALGKDIDGAPTSVDLAKMPHLLVAGTTGSGKSVSVNSMIVSLLYNATPDDVRMIMVDPKMLELSIYEGIPHLLLPVVTDPKKANLALRWAVEEMERRYDLLATMGVRDIATYNRRIEKLLKEREADALDAAARAARLAADDDSDGDDPASDGVLAAGLFADMPPTKLPKIVVIIDEFADLMMCAPKEVETSVARIAQKARAAGIHLIIATQRPSVDVITGLIKANFPSRAAFRVTSKVDSRTILDHGGAESLLGAGDMLFSDRGTRVRRIHGCYVGEDEIRNIVEFLKTQGKPVYNLDIIRPREEDAEGGAPAAEELDEMYDRAVSLVAETRQVSISMIQRRLRVGYNRAARMVEHMEREGVVSPPDGTNRREVLIQPAA
jgi:DNA segregation ATPase FtsK/SpoIIIE, S-DNA-T family